MALELSFLNSRVSQRIFGLFVLCAFLPTIAFATLSYVQVTKQLDEQSKMRLYKGTKTVGMGILERLLYLKTDITILCSFYISEYRAGRQPAIDVLGDRLVQRFHGVSIISSGGEKTCLFGQVKNPPKLNGAEKQHLIAGKVLLSYKPTDKGPTRIFMWKIIDRKQADEKILLAEINPGYIWGIGEDSSDTFPPMTELCVLDPSNRMLFTSMPTLSSAPGPIGSNVTHDHSAAFIWNHQGRAYIANQWPIFLKPVFHVPSWTVVLSESRAEIFAPMDHFKMTFLPVALLSFMIVFLASLIQIRKSLRPIESLAKGTRRISEGDFNTKVEIESGDEFEDLGNSFNSMSEKIKEEQALLVQTAKMGAIGQMAAGIVHEINQPMTSIFGLLELCLLEEVPEPQKNRLEKLRTAVERLMGIVTKFRSFSRFSKGDEMVPLAINHVIDGVYSLLEHQIQMKKVKCTIEKSEGLPLVSGDKNSLQQVLINLIINALDELESKQDGDAELMIKTYRRNDELCVDVRDNGSGIPEDIQKHIFDPFFTTKSAEKGTGLGLAIIQDILHNHNAQIDVESREGDGTCFTVSFPT